MQQMDKWHKELDKLSSRRYKRMDGDLYNFYKSALKQLNIEVKGYLDNYEQLSFSKRLEVENQLHMARRIDEIVSNLAGSTAQTVNSYVRDELQQGYMGVWYALEGAENIQLDFGMLPERYIQQLVAKKVDGKTFSKRLYSNRDDLADRVTTSLLGGAVRGDGYKKIAKQVGELTEANYKQALRIARTEGGRVQSTGKQRAYEEAKDKGIDIQKRWLSTLDKKTRHSHQQLDGQTVEIEEEFVSDSRAKAMGPRMFGKPQEDINCRCTTITIVNDIEPELRKDIETKEIIKYNNYNEWAEAKGYKEAANKFKGVITDVDFSKPRRTIAKKILHNLGLEEIPISVKKIQARGHCMFNTDADGTITMTEYALNSQDDRSSNYQVKTIFHEAYHAMNHGRKSDMRTGAFSGIDWLDIEETFAETSSHYAIKQAGIDAKLSPAYPDKLVNVLPRLKQLDRFKNASTLSDFGEVAWNERLAGQASTWESLAKEVNDIQHDWVSYGKQYEKYIKENETDLLGLMLQNMPQYDNEQIRGMMLGDLHSALDKAENGGWLNSNEEMVYSNILVVAMNLIGVK
ncbi:phage head morphogenesis protein [Streptococcus parasuis]|uniref:phage head morphogenesis protein n=1 Tax=Streptococcus parasuis TaxID=1501662 RepID=UPI001C1FBA3A|nr:phage minor head protein [Streptococcus parasuis]QWV87426.1 phage head morphogenesis protein [Streptococcus parasuis]